MRQAINQYVEREEKRAAFRQVAVAAWDAYRAAGLRDVQRLYRFLADNGEDAGRRAISAIRQGVKMIARQPGIGRPADDMDPDYREWPIEFSGSGYVVLYRFHQRPPATGSVRYVTGHPPSIYPK